MNTTSSTSNEPTTIIVEAEDHIVSGYITASADFTSGGAFASLFDPELGAFESPGTGQIEFTFSGPSGIYDAELFHFDESDGNGSVEIAINGETISTIITDQNPGSSGPNESSYVSTVLSDLVLNLGDTITITGFTGGAEWARVDSMVFTGGPTSIFIEAEDLIVDGFELEAADSSSNGGVAAIRAPGVQTGTLSYTYTGDDGFFDLVLAAHDENDGAGTIEILINGTSIKTFVLDADIDHGPLHLSNENLVSLVFENLELSNGDVIDIRATRDGGELSRIDTFALNQVEVPQPESIFLEAESLISDGFVIENSGVASSGQLAGIRGEGVQTGTLSYTFDGVSCSYDMSITTHDENDGVSTIEVLVNGDVIETFTLDADIDHGPMHIADENRVTLNLEGLDLVQGDVIEVRATRDQGEHARIDTIELIPSADAAGHSAEESSGDEFLVAGSAQPAQIVVIEEEEPAAPESYGDGSVAFEENEMILDLGFANDDDFLV